jgi:hypothetical protein
MVAANSPSERVAWKRYKRLVFLLGAAAWLTFIAIPKRPNGPTEFSAIAQLRTINTMEVTFLSSNGRYGTIPELIGQGLLDPRFAGLVAGYAFTVEASGNDYTASAMPASVNAGRYGYNSWPDAVIRYQEKTSPNCTPCFPAGQSGQPAG